MNLIEGLMADIEKCRRIQAQCDEIGAPGNILRTLLELSIQRAVMAIANNDVVAMIQAARDLQGYEE